MVSYILPQSRAQSNHLPIPKGHRYFSDCLRENNARLIAWALTLPGSSWFVSLTFKNELSYVSADLKFRAWAGRIRQALNDTGGSELRWVRCLELQTRGVIHFHAIVQGQGLEKLSRTSWKERWLSLDRNTGFARIYPALESSAPYLAKYCSKHKPRHGIEWGGYWRGLKAPASTACYHSRVPFREGHLAQG
jgi:hypothetical protein